MLYEKHFFEHIKVNKIPEVDLSAHMPMTETLTAVTRRSQPYLVYATGHYSLHHQFIYIYIYIYRERERGGWRERDEE